MQTKLNANVIDAVVIEPRIRLAWLDALADISKQVRVIKGAYNVVLSFSEETAQLTPGGVLTLRTFIDGERVEMDVPSGAWKWNKKEIHQQQQKSSIG